MLRLPEHSRRMVMAEQIRAQDVFDFLRPEQVHVISEASDKVDYAAGETVYERGAKAAHIYAVLDGEVTLRLPGKSGVSIVIDQLAKGGLFGSCICVGRETYALTAQCSADSKLLRIEHSVLKRLMDGDLVIGYALQSRFSAIYFGRYVETMKKLQAIVMNIPVETD